MTSASRTFVFVTLAAAFGDDARGEATTAAAFKVVANAGNPVGAVHRVDVAAYFLKKVTRWPKGQCVQPVDQSASSAIRAAFTREVLRYPSAKDVQSYWQRQIFSGRDVPPAVKASDEAVLAFVSSTAGAIGYVSAGATLPRGVKTLTVTESP